MSTILDTILRRKHEEVAARRAQVSLFELKARAVSAGAGEDRSALIEALGSGMIGASADKAEGVAAFAEKRKPVFPGE